MQQYFEIAGSGSYLPAICLDAEEVDQRAGVSIGWTKRHTGVLTRYECRAPENLGSMAVNAVQGALDDAALSWGDMDLLIDASGTQGQLIPCNAISLVREISRSLGVKPDGRQVAAMDVHGTCLGFMLALNVANGLFSMGESMYRHIAIICTEAPLTAVNWNQPESAGLVGDGAAAIILRRTDRGDDYQFIHETYPNYFSACQIKGGGYALPAFNYKPDNDSAYRFDMDGGQLTRAARKYFAPMVHGLIDQSTVELEQCQVIPHQASPRILEMVRRWLAIQPDRFHVNADNVGNLVAASIPMTIDLCRRNNRLHTGQSVMLLGTSAGYAQAATIFKL